MISSLRESKARLSELVERASKGEDVLITVRGKVKARLTRAVAPDADVKQWIEELRELRRKYSTRRRGKSIQEILDEVREDRF